MGGSSIASPSAAGWVTDFLNAAYYARPRAQRDLDDLRLALCILTTSWHRRGRRLRMRDLGAFNRAFGRQRLRGGPTLDRAALLTGGERLLGEGFAAGYDDPSRRGWGVVFSDSAERAAFDPQRRIADGALRELTEPQRPDPEQRWHTYDAVQLPSADGALAVLAATERWQDFASELGGFTALRRNGLAGQTFEIQVAARLMPRTPIFMRAYVTATRVLLRATEPAELDAYVDRLTANVDALPAGGRAEALVELTTHAGHFLGRGRSRLLIFEHEGRAFIRDVGSWDPLPPHLAAAYALGGKRAQGAFWGEGTPAQGVFQQLARLAG